MWKVIGHPKAVGLLQHSLKYNRLAHAYLLVGQPHVGKTTMAINLAQALNCEQDDKPCEKCSSCVRIENCKHPDVQIIRRLSDTETKDASSKKEISIGQIRSLQQSAALQPYEGRYRVFIIDSAEHLNDESANCLLKTLEEPPDNVVIILLTTTDERLLPTLISRCRRIELFPPHAEIIEQALIEKHNIAPEQAKTLSRICNGSIGWAISASLNEALVEERSARLAELLELTNCNLEHRFTFAAKLATQFTKNRDTVQDKLQLWVEWWWDILLIKAGCIKLITNVDQEATLVQLAEKYSLTEIRGFIEAIRESIKQLEYNVNPRLALEILMLNIPHESERNEALSRLGQST